MCAEFCGLDHHKMFFDLRIVTPDEFAEWTEAAIVTTLDRRDLLDVDDFIAGPDVERRGLPRTLIGWLTTTDHKAIGIAYAVTALAFLAVGGTLAGIIRTELAQPGLQFVDEATYNSVFTIHGSVMVYLFAVPFGFALANYLVPLADRRPRPGVPPPQRARRTGCTCSAG